jgi:hypothetical protein
VRRATEVDHRGLALLQPEASRPAQDRIIIIIIIQREKGPGKHDLYIAPDFQHYTRE